MVNQAFGLQNQNNIGGYPYGYPPTMQQTMPMQVPQQPSFAQGQYSPFVSPFQNPNPQQMQPINPGVNVPLELEDGKGNKVTIPATEYNQGGTTVSQGGFNPMNGVTSMPVADKGFNPYMQFIGNPGYSTPQLNMNFANGCTGSQQPVYSQQPSQGFSPYVPTQPYMGYGYNPAYYGYGAQSQFDSRLQEILYEQEPSIVDTRAMLEQIVLSDKEREKINHRGYIVGHDYYGNPIYNSYYENQQRQNAFEEARVSYQKHFTMLSRIAHGYYNEEIDEEKTMKMFDPVPPQPVSKQKIFDHNNATEEEKKEFERESRLEATQILHMKADAYERNLPFVQQQIDYMKGQIKASHDRMIGVEPGEHYDLKTYLDNGFRLNVNIAVQEAKSANRNGTNKYSRNGFRANLSQDINASIPMTSKDDEYVSIEKMIKNVYDRNKRIDSIFKNTNGQITYTAEPVSGTEFETHQEFLNAMQRKKVQDDIRKAVV